MFDIPSGYYETLRAMSLRSGWAERGGHAIRDARTGEVKSRTVWAGKPDWARGFRYNVDEWCAIVEKAIAGKRLGRMQTLALQSMISELELDGYDTRWGRMSADEEESALDEIFGADTNPGATPRAAPALAPSRRVDPAEEEKASPALAEPARPHTPAKAREHFRERDRTPEAINDIGKSATILAMRKPKKSNDSRQKPGRPPLPGRRIVIKLPDDAIAKAKQLGNDNIAEGVREALKRVKAG
jgi:hypothetical protein